MGLTTAFLAMLAASLVPAVAPGPHGEARIVPAALSPTTDIIVTFDFWRFDGSWNVVVFCPESDGAPASAFRFMARVKDGVLHGERGSAGARGWMILDGAIQPDGTARLDASGITNDADELRGVTPADTSYAYRVQARFEGSHGIGGRMEGRSCTLHFTRQ